MAWYWWYCLISLAIGIATEVYEDFYPDVPYPEEELECLDNLAVKGHLQKEVYGERAVYHPKDETGEIELELLKEKKNGKSMFHLILDVIINSILWPITLCEWIYVNFFKETN